MNFSQTELAYSPADTEVAPADPLPEASAPEIVAPKPEPASQPAKPAIDYVNLVEPAQVLAVSDGLPIPLTTASSPDLSLEFAPIVRSTGWQSARPADTSEILASLGDLQFSPPAIREVPEALSDQRASVAANLVPELHFEDLANAPVLIGIDEPKLVQTETAHRLASYGPTTAETLFPNVLIDPLPEQALAETLTPAEPEAPVEAATLDPVPEPTAPTTVAVETPTYALKPQPRPKRPVVAEKPKEAAPKAAAPKVAAISEVSVAGSKRVSVVGVFQTRSAAWALLALDNGQIVKVTNGTKLSTLRVSRIRGDKIWIRVGNAEKSLRAGDVIRVN
ncbi:hypothetical protein [Aliiroseovarius sp. S253]|uniref:hypothetical protein n=1 Tax=Aliiroseovarius sp. S253 TaxID=3415133 RepID=UPI003C7D2D94